MPTGSFTEPELMYRQIARQPSALQAIESNASIADAIARLGLGAAIDPAAELEAGRMLAPIDHEDPAHLIMSGTGQVTLGGKAPMEHHPIINGQHGGGPLGSSEGATAH